MVEFWYGSDLKGECNGGSTVLDRAGKIASLLYVSVSAYTCHEHHDASDLICILVQSYVEWWSTGPYDVVGSRDSQFEDFPALIAHQATAFPPTKD
jgi:hypothetical protein